MALILMTRCWGWRTGGRLRTEDVRRLRFRTKRDGRQSRRNSSESFVRDPRPPKHVCQGAGREFGRSDERLDAHRATASHPPADVRSQSSFYFDVAQNPIFIGRFSSLVLLYFIGVITIHKIVDLKV